MRRVVLVLLLVLLLAYLFTGVRQIRPGERAVVRRLGRVMAEKPAPGLWIGLPWGMDRVDRVPVNLVRRIEVGYRPEMEENGAPAADQAEASEQTTLPPGQLLTGDHNLVNVRVALDYAVSPRDEDIVDYVLHRDRVEGLLARTAEAVMIEWAAGKGIDDILIRGKSDLAHLLAPQVQERIGRYGLGIQVHEASVLHLLPPDEVKTAFDDVTRAHADIRTREEEALRRAGQDMGKARTEAYGKEQQAMAYTDEQHRRAHAEADSFLVRLRQYRELRRQNPEILTAMWWDEMSRIFADMKESGRLDLLDNHLGSDGLDITQVPPLPRKK